MREQRWSRARVRTGHTGAPAGWIARLTLVAPARYTVFMLNLKSLLTRDELATINAKLDAATWVDGRETASGPTRKIKNNLQLGSEDPLARELGETVKAALLRNDLLLAAAFPDRVAPVRFAAYRPGMTYGWHADLDRKSVV